MLVQPTEKVGSTSATSGKVSMEPHPAAPPEEVSFYITVRCSQINKPTFIMNNAIWLLCYYKLSTHTSVYTFVDLTKLL